MTSTTTLHVEFVSESAGFENTFGWYNKATGVGGILFANVEAEGNNAPLRPGVSAVDFTVNTADVGNIEYFLIPNGGDIGANSNAELSGGVKVIQLSDGTWAVATLNSNGTVQTGSNGKPNILVGEGANAFFTEKAKNEGGVDHASSAVGSNQTAATLAGDTADGATGLDRVGGSRRHQEIERHVDRAGRRRLQRRGLPRHGQERQAGRQERFRHGRRGCRRDDDQRAGQRQRSERRCHQGRVGRR